MPWRLAGRLEILDDAIALGGGGVDRHEVVVVQVDAPRADLGQQRDRIDRRQRIAHDVAERIAAAIADGPQAERELVFRPRCVSDQTCMVDPCKVRSAG